MRPRVLIAGVLAALLVAWPVSARRAGAAAASVTPAASWGYVRMDDGAQLRYQLLRPSPQGRFPVAFDYGPYLSGSDLVIETLQAKRLLAAGYAVLGVNIRGTGCSSGHFDAFERREARDAVDVIEWAAQQRWSTGHLGMFGLSAPGISQYGPAGLHAPHLDAIAPFQTSVDFYRDIVYPGGIPEASFPALWGLAVQPEYSDRASATALSQGDKACAAHTAARQADNVPYNVFLPTAKHTFDDGWYRGRDPEQYVPDIRIPVLGCVAWQDDEVGSRSLYTFDTLNPETSWIIGTNGYHGACDAANAAPYLIRFFDHFVKGVANGFEKSPHVTLLHDAHATVKQRAQTTVQGTEPSTEAWTTTFARWPVPVATKVLHLHDDGRLGADAAGREAPDRYRTPLPSSANESGAVAGQTNAGWKAPDVPGASLTYTTPALDRDAELFGPASANLWMTSTATDTDLQVTLSEVRPDGREVYVERGWLRASHRVLDPTRSIVLRPFHTHHAADAEPLTPGAPTLIRVELSPFDYVFRAGSHLRLTIGTPTSSGAFLFRANPTPSTNTILHDGAHDSQLMFGLVPGGHAITAFPPCDSLLNQPCRRNTAPVPAGTITLG